MAVTIEPVTNEHSVAPGETLEIRLVGRIGSRDNWIVQADRDGELTVWVANNEYEVFIEGRQVERDAVDRR